VAYGKSSIATIARLVMDAKKANEKLEIRGHLFRWRIFQRRPGRGKVSKCTIARRRRRQHRRGALGPGRNLPARLKAGRQARRNSQDVQNKTEEAPGDAAPDMNDQNESRPAAHECPRWGQTVSA